MAALVRRLGVARLEVAEDAVQDAMMQALRRWPFHGIPPEPRAWLFTVARHRAIDALRRERRAHEAEPLVAAALPDAPSPHAVDDDALGLLLLCCDPALPRDAAVALTLHVVGGFAAGEIARALLLGEPAVAQRLVRAKRRLRELAAARPELPRPAAALPARLPAVLDALHQLFTLGHAAADGDAVARADICLEALRLARGVAAHPAGDVPEAHALTALVALQAARLPTRADDGGAVVLLADQPRDRWDQALLALGFRHLDRAARGTALSRYHLEAQVAALHAAAPSFEATDWPAVLAAYDALARVAPDGVTALNRVVAVAMVRGAAAALAEFAAADGDPALAAYPWRLAVKGWLLERTGDRAAAAAAYGDAALLTGNAAQRRLMEARARAVAGP